MRVVILLLLALQAPPAFEVASVKPTVHGRDANDLSMSSVGVTSPGRFVAENGSLFELLMFGWNLKDYQISGPAWLNDHNECLDIQAKAPAGTSKKPIREMVRTLLAERFGLRVHVETRPLPVYDLVVGKGGPKLVAAVAGGHSGTSSRGGDMTATSVTMAEFAYQLSRELKRPVFDKTGIAGAFDLTLHYSTDPDAGPDAGAAPSLFRAVEETLGLKLVPAKEPVDILVVDHIEKTATEN